MRNFTLEYLEKYSQKPIFITSLRVNAFSDNEYSILFKHHPFWKGGPAIGVGVKFFHMHIKRENIKILFLKNYLDRQVVTRVGVSLGSVDSSLFK